MIIKHQKHRKRYAHLNIDFASADGVIMEQQPSITTPVVASKNKIASISPKHAENNLVAMQKKVAPKVLSLQGSPRNNQKLEE